MPPAYKLDVSLAGLRPRIFRQIVIAESLPLQIWVMVVATAMGWPAPQDWCIAVGDDVFTSNKSGRFPPAEADATSGRLSLRLGYAWWDHKWTVKSTRIATRVPALCIGGARACPPADCAGVEDFQMLYLHHYDAEMRGLRDWLRGPFNPKAFDIKAVNARLDSLWADVSQ